jgi:hypothetical protein
MTNSVWTHSAIKGFASLNPSDKDVDNVNELLQEIVEGRADFVAVPIVKEFGTVYVAQTQDKKWAILFRFDSPNKVTLLTVYASENFASKMGNQ